ncbi:flavodoxin family protein [Paratractidigestivibacter sp.]|uniref:flavodoxin family protein n=1 Tax=Paratractidigestivibacter sp. TaxID=2847316 RepID=UPI002ABD5C0F|nr:flavodoxin family protein [Paratractidigestivibacter sp.]
MEPLLNDRQQLKVLLVNAGPHKAGCTNRALEEVACALREEGLATEMFWVGNKPMASCLACRQCDKLGRCVMNDRVNDFVALAPEFDGIVLGSPVHFGAATGAATAFYDRAFYALLRSSAGNALRMKVGAAVTSCRRAGNTTTIDQLNRYFQLMQMPIATSSYWNIVHGATPADVEQDAEGLRTMRTLGHNMAFLIKAIHQAEQAGVQLAQPEPRVYTNFVR